jgi:GxxExxY protein
MARTAVRRVSSRTIALARRLQNPGTMPFDRCPVITRVIGCAIDVHRGIGPGLLESAYNHCLAYKLAHERIRFARQVPLPVMFEEVRIECGYRMDFVVDDTVVVELKSVERLLPIHSAQVLTYVKLSGLRYGLLINFNVPRLVDGVRTLLNPALATLPTFPTCDQ